MLLLSSFLAIVALSSGVPTTRIPPTVCDGFGPPITLTPSGWVLPLTSYADYQDCKYSFKVPKDYYAYVDLDAYQLRFQEQVVIRDNFGIAAMSNLQQHGVNSFSNLQSWPVDFSISIMTKDGTGAQLSVNITLLPATPNANIVKSYVTFVNSGSVFIDAKDWNDGESYKFTSKNGYLYMVVASLNTASDDDVHKWNNVFIYEGGVFQQTLAHAAQVGRLQQAYNSRTNEVILYMSKKVDTVGAAMITDQSNVNGARHNAEYVPVVPGSFPYQISSSFSGNGAVTLVSSRTNPTNVTVQMLYNTDGNGVFSYIGGGPLNSHSNDVKLTDAQLPYAVSGFANTFYLSTGEGVIGFDVRP